MKNELFDNPNDWLTKQRKEEARISAWDMDDAQKLKEEHAEKHARENLYSKRMQIKYASKTNSDISNNDINLIKHSFGRVIKLIFTIYLAGMFVQLLAFLISSGLFSELIYRFLAS